MTDLRYVADPADDTDRADEQHYHDTVEADRLNDHGPAHEDGRPAGTRTTAKPNGQETTA